MDKYKELQSKANEIRKMTIKEIGELGVGHVGGAIDLAKKTKGVPHMILLHTIKGKGIYFAENKVSSHNMPVTEEMWKKAVAEIEGGQE